MNISNGFVPLWPVTKASFAAYLRGDENDEAAMMLSIVSYCERLSWPFG